MGSRDVEREGGLYHFVVDGGLGGDGVAGPGEECVVLR